MILEVKSFNEAIEEVSRGNAKLPQSSFLTSGSLAVVDQGRSLIAGYTDEHSLRCKVNGPVIVFGDHTRVVKFVDFPFVMGADGIKVLRVREGWDPKYVYHFLRWRDIPSAGYSRHYKFLKEISVPKPGLEDQRRIAAILDQIDAVRTMQHRQLDLLDSLSQAIYQATLSQCRQDRRLGELAEFIRGVVFKPEDKTQTGPSTVAVIRTKNIQKRLDRTDEIYIPTTVIKRPEQFISQGDILISSANSWNLVGKACLVNELTTPAVIGGFITGLRGTSAVDSTYLFHWFTSDHVQSTARSFSNQTTGIANLDLKRCADLRVPIPTLEAQQKFVDRIAHVDKQHIALQRGIALNNELLVSLQQRAFTGQL